MEFNFLKIWIVILGLLVSCMSSAVIIDFEGLEVFGANLSDEGSAVVEDGFIISTSGANGLFSINNADFRFIDTPSLFNNTVNGTTIIEAVDGSAFDLFSIDLAELNSAAIADVTFIRDGGFSQTFTLDGIFGESETFFFDSGFLNTTSVSFLQGSPFHQFDNIVINVGVSEASEPTTLAIFALGLMGLAARRFKKTHNKEQ